MRRANYYALFSQMSDVEAGGATVIPYLGAMISPKKVISVLCRSLVASGHRTCSFPCFIP